jgi:hypothetical protein
MKTSITATLMLVATLMIMPGVAGAGRPQLAAERLEVGRALLEVQFANVAEVLPYYTDDIEYHDPVVDIYGIEQMTGFLYQLLGASPDLVTTIEDESLNGDTYAATWVMAGQFLGVPYEAKGISIFKFRPRSSMVYYQRDYYSEGDIMATIPGLDQAILGFRTYYKCAVDPTFECPLDGPPAVGASDADKHGCRASHRGSERRLRSRVHLQRERMEIGRQLVEINATNWTNVLPYLATDYEYHDPIVDIYGPETMAEFLARLFAGSSDLYTVVEDEVLAGDIYMATWTMSGLFNGAPFSAPGMSIVKFAEGSVQSYYSRDYYTEGDVMLGVPELAEAVVGFRVYYRCAVDPTFDCPLPPPAGADAAFDKADTPAAGAFGLQQNVPNPFNPSTQISFAVPEGGANVALRIYDVTGRLVRTLVDGYEPSGARTVTWAGRDDQGQPVASGTYFYQLTAPSFSERKKMVLLK